MKKGFSLIELLVVISIMAILIGVSIVSYNNVRRNTRDSRRQVDLENVRQALVMYRSDIGCYPPGVDYAEMMDALALSEYWVGAIPLDPKNIAPNIYVYTPGADATYCSPPGGGVGVSSFSITATFERDRDGSPTYTVVSP